jgi:hypothetical protein
MRDGMEEEEEEEEEEEKQVSAKFTLEKQMGDTWRKSLSPLWRS